MRLTSIKQTQKIFLSTNTKVGNLSESKFDIIVSPEFYWVRKFEIPVKTETQAENVLPTLFEDIIEDISDLTYQAIKLDEKYFLCFAYSNKIIYDALKNSNLPISQINALYFAQNECKKFNNFEIDKQKYLYTNEEILIKIPDGIVEDTISLDKVIDTIELSPYKLQIRFYNNLLSTQVYNLFFAILAVLIVMNGIKYFSYKNEINSIEGKIVKLKESNNLPASMIQTNAILKTYESKVLKQKKTREAISYILSKTRFDLKSLRIENNEIKLEYLSANKNEIEGYLKKKFKNLFFEVNHFSLKVRIKL